MKRVLITDCGSTTTKAILFEHTPNGWRMIFRSESPTTVEDPVSDVTIGALNAFKLLQELSGIQFLKESGNTPFITPSTPTSGIDLYLSTSSAGGGLQMAVGGISKDRSGKAAERAALGAGAIVLDSFCFDDGRDEFQRIEQLRHIRPDIFLLAGGTNNGGVQNVEIAELLGAAAPKPRFGESILLPVIYAGNPVAKEEVERLLKDKATVVAVRNVQPIIDEEELDEARDMVHELFLSHVMSHAPGYKKLLTWTPHPIIPTPSAVGEMIESFSRESGLTVLCADIGGATTDIFSAYKNRACEVIFSRTVSANLGMSYSIGNVLSQAGIDSIRRWITFDANSHDLKDKIRNKMIRPTTLPQNDKDLELEQAVCREALRLSYVHHRNLSRAVVKRRKGEISDIFNQNVDRDPLHPMEIDIVIGSGGVLSHAPERIQAVYMMLEGFGLQGVTEVAVDSVFMLPHLGVLNTVSPDAAQEIFVKDCLIRLAVTVVPVFPKSFKGEKLATVYVDDKEVGKVNRSVVTQMKIDKEFGIVKVVPASSKVSVTGVKGATFEREMHIGQEGIILDGRATN